MRGYFGQRWLLGVACANRGGHTGTADVADRVVTDARMDVKGETSITMATFELYTDKASQYRFRLKADNGEIILASEGYTTKASAQNGIESVRTNAPVDSRYERKQTTSGFSFNLRAANNQVIGTSEVYTSEAGRENGISAVKKGAPGAGVREV